MRQDAVDQEVLVARAVEHEQLYFVPPDLLQRHTPRIIEGADQLCRHISDARAYYRRANEVQ